MKTLDAKLLKKFLKLACDRLEGDWVLIGGTLLPILGMDLRVTTDIDLVALDQTASNEKTLAVMKLADELGLPIETINQAGLYFLEKIKNYRSSLVILKQGKRSTIYRPDVNLYLLLKIPRMTESDFHDCCAFLKFAKQNKEPMNVRMIIQTIKLELDDKTLFNEGKKTRLEQLLTLIS